MLITEKERKLIMKIEIEAHIYYRLRKLAQKLNMTYTELIRHLIELESELK